MLYFECQVVVIYLLENFHESTQLHLTNGTYSACDNFNIREPTWIIGRNVAEKVSNQMIALLSHLTLLVLLHYLTKESPEIASFHLNAL